MDGRRYRLLGGLEVIEEPGRSAGGDVIAALLRRRRAPQGRVPAAGLPWLDATFDRAMEYAYYAGLALGAAA